MSYIIRRTDGFYARTPYQKPTGKPPILTASPKWDTHTRSATRFDDLRDAEQIAGQLQNPPRGVEIEVIDENDA